MADLDRCGYCGKPFIYTERMYSHMSDIVCFSCHKFLHSDYINSLLDQYKPIIKKLSRYEILDFD